MAFDKDCIREMLLYSDQNHGPWSGTGKPTVLDTSLLAHAEEMFEIVEHLAKYGANISIWDVVAEAQEIKRKVEASAIA